MDRDISFGAACAALSGEVWNSIPAGSRLTQKDITRLCERSAGFLMARTGKPVSFEKMHGGPDERSVYVTFVQDGAPPYDALFRWPERARVSVVLP